MKRISALLLVALLSLTGVAQAQNVLLPTPATTTVKTKSAASTAPPDTTSSTQQVPILPNTLPNTPIPATTSLSSASVAALTSPSYLPTIQQNNLIEAEKQNLVSSQQSLAQMPLAIASINAQLQAPNQTQDQKQMLLQAQQSIAQTMAQLNDQVMKSQRRLAVLQAGPVRTSDLSELYQ